uniref:non-ribosomal peptide synthetase n=1 Tax=Marichromatium purpuratum TaxID=37487 RepID=UPI001E5AFC83|nr:non-ribosomal peptide synthetase [Marichromatium purpuratum]
MVPHTLLELDALPLSANGKVDRKALTALLEARVDEQVVTLEPPRGETERRVAAVWSALLGAETLGRESNFFDLGGDSLLATRAVTALREQGLSAPQPLRLLFAQPRLMDFAAGLTTTEETRAPVTIVADPEHRYEPFALTEVQQAYWMGQSPGLPLSCGTWYLLELDGEHLDLERFEAAWNRLIRHHEMLRAVVDEDGRQRILAEVAELRLMHGAAAELAGEDSAAAAQRYLRRRWRELSARRDAAAEWPPLEIHALAYGGTRQRVGILFNYLVLDGYSIQLLLGQLAELHARPQAELPDIGLSFRDYVEQLSPDPAALLRAEAFWRERLLSLPPGPELPLATDPQTLTEMDFQRREARLDAACWARLKTRARAHRITPSVLLLTAYGQVIRSWTGGRDFTLNLTLFDRQRVHPDVDRVLGDFTSLAPVRFLASHGDALLGQAQALQQEIAEALEYREVSSIWVQRERARGTHLANSSLPVVFTSTLGMGELLDQAPADFPRLVSGGLSGTPQVWLDHQLYEYQGSLTLSWDAVESLFPAGLLDDMFAAYLELLGRLAEQDWTQPTLPQLPSPQQATRAAVNATAAPRRGHLLHAGLFEWAARAPERPALLAGEHRLGYGELAAEALRIGALLRARGVAPGEAVAVSLPRGPAQVAAVYGVLAAGACYVPVGVRQPAARQARIHASAAIRWVLTDAAHREAAASPGTVPLDIAEAAGLEPLAAPVTVDPEQRAYIIFTSGSTGAPKGVEVSHAAAVNTLENLAARYAVGPDSRVLAVSALDFDLSVHDLFGLHAVGGAVVVLEESQRRDAGAWLEQIHRHGVTLWNSVPVLLDMLLVMAERDPRPLPFEQVYLSGDWIGLDLPERLFARSRPGVRLVAMGGATEAAIWSNAHDVELPLPPHWRSIPYGRPLANQRYRVVDAQGRDCPDWVPGELWIGGLGVALGYCGDPELTAQRFVEHAGERWYRTGDQGRYWPDGTLEFLGRLDHQVKVRGHRIELGEIEAALNGQAEIARAVALTHGTPAALAAVLVPAAGAVLDQAAIGARLREALPDYMVPHTLLELDALPLSANGKVDRKALTALLEARVDEQVVTLEPPRGETERRVAAVWSALLGAETLGRESNFFDLGGDSLLATRAVTALREQGLSAPQPLRLLFAQPRLMDFAAGLTTTEEPRAPVTIVADPEHRYEPFALTEVQQAYWMGQLPGLPLNCGTHYLLEFDGAEIDRARLQHACDRLVARHEMLRSVLDSDGRQRILPADAVAAVEVSDEQAGDATEAATRVLSWWREQTRQPVPPGFTLHRVRYPAGRCRLGLLLDYMSLDGYSIRLLVQELAALYDDPQRSLPEIGVSFRDYLMQVHPDPRDVERAEAHWHARLHTLPRAAALPLARDPYSLSNPHFSRRTLRLQGDDWGRLKQAARQRNITPSVLVLAAYGEVLSRWSGGAAHTVNLTRFDRQPLHPDIGSLIGDFTSLSPIAYRPEAGASLFDRAEAMQQEIAEALDHREVSSIWVQRERGKTLERMAAALPIIFTSTLGMSDGLLDEMPEDFPELVHGGLSETPQVWLDHQMYEHRGDLLISWDSVDALFPDGLLDDMLAALGELLERLARHADALPSPQLPSPQQATRAAVNATAAPRRGHLLHAGLFEWAARAPERPALLAGEHRLGYGELAAEALRIGALLRARGVAPGEAVAVSLPRGPAQVAAVYGVLAAGACYVPVGVRQPAARQARIHASAAIRWVLTDAAHREAAASPGTVPLDIAEAAGLEPLAAPVTVDPEQRAYIIFTSGSTGAPKGVEVSHAAAVNTLENLAARYAVGPDSRVLAVSALDFDLSVHDLFGLHAVGGAVVVLEESQRRDAGAWLEQIHRHGVTLWNSVPVLLDMLLVMAERDPRPLPFEQVYLSGDWIGLDLPERLFARSRPGVRLVAMGGATEAAIWSNAHDVELPLPPHWRSIPYGRPLANQRYRVVDAQGRDCPDWVPGELWIGGLGVALGYCGDPELTAQRFVEHAGERWYRTGDQGRYWPDGTLEFLGRLDHQVKVRGHRIELGEIEAVLNGQAEIARAVALTHGTPAALAAVLVPAAGAVLDQAAIGARLREALPDYMVPHTLLELDALPLSANGKVDRKALTALLEAQVVERRAYEPPRDHFEEQVAAIWCEVLGVERISREDEFFLVGGDSLNATRIAGLLQERHVCPQPITLQVFFSSPTVAALADHVREQWQAFGVTDDNDDLIEEGIL